MPADQPTDIVARLRAPMWRIEPVDIQAVAEAAAVEIELLRAKVAAVDLVCAEHEGEGFCDPGRAMDAVRDALGRRK